MPSKKTRDRARELRLQMTAAEMALWQRLRKRSLGVRFRRQFAIGPFIADFVCLSEHLIIEVDGTVHDDDHTDYDERRTAFLERLGFRVIRFTNDEVGDHMDWVITEIKTALARTTQ